MYLSIGPGSRTGFLKAYVNRIKPSALKCRTEPTMEEKQAFPDRIWFSGWDSRPADNTTGYFVVTNDAGKTAPYWMFTEGQLVTPGEGTFEVVDIMNAPTERSLSQSSISMLRRYIPVVRVFFQRGCNQFAAQLNPTSGTCYGNFATSATRSMYLPSGMNSKDIINFYSDRSCRTYQGQIWNFAGCASDGDFSSFYPCTLCR